LEKKIFTSIAVWAIILNHFAFNWANYTLLTWMPSYIKNVLKFDIQKAGLLAVLPYIGNFISSAGIGFLADYLIEKWWSTTTVRKVVNIFAFLSAALFLAIVGHIKSVTLAITVMTLSLTGIGFCSSGWAVNHIDVSAEHAGILMGISNTVATIPGIISPTLSGYILGDTNDIERWQEIYYITSAILIFGAIIWLFFASGKKQF